MNNFSVILSDTADLDIEEIHNHINSKLLSPESADGTVKAILDAAHSLTSMPKRYPLIDEFIFEYFNYRMMPVKNYLVFYTVEDSGTVYIERVIYNRRNWQEMFAGSAD
jgi:toxin ParE1/3/4